jgi:hypothetical protein
MKQAILLDRPYNTTPLFETGTKRINFHPSGWLLDKGAQYATDDYYVSYWYAPAHFCLSPRRSWVGIISKHTDFGPGLHVVEKLETSRGSTYAYLLLD